MMRKTGNFALFLLAVAACYGMLTTKPHYADFMGPIPVHGTVGEKVPARTFETTVRKVTFARRLKGDRFGKPVLLTTAGIWAIVSVDFAARDNSTMIGLAAWRGPTGLRYGLTERLSFAAGMLPVIVDPGLPAKGRLVFEIRPEEASGATLLIANKLLSALDSQTEISLGPVIPGGDGLPQGTLETYDLEQAL